ncbi:MAG: ATP-binding cassette domain-containing protein, partial [Planctomycetales bacterium]
MHPDFVLQLDHYGVAFGNDVVLADLCLDVPRNGVVTLMGPGGVGKSTLLRSLAGLNKGNPSWRAWGQAVYNGTRIGEGAPPAFVMQKAKLVTASVLENLLSNLPERSGLTQREQTVRAREILSEFQLDELADGLMEDVISLPLGMQRCLSIVRATLPNPPLVCVDEPTMELDEEFHEHVLRIIQREAERRAVLMVTHNRQDALTLGGHAALLVG